MSNLPRKIKHHSNQESVMKKIKELYYFKGALIEVLNYNKDYFKDSKHFLNSYKCVFSYYFFVCEMEIMSFIDYLKESVDKSDMQGAIMRECDFSIKDEHIFFQDTDSTEINFVNMGQLLFGKYKINFCGSNMFIQDLDTNIKYFYYEDYENDED